MSWQSSNSNLNSDIHSSHMCTNTSQPRLSLWPLLNHLAHITFSHLSVDSLPHSGCSSFKTPPQVWHPASFLWRFFILNNLSHVCQSHLREWRQCPGCPSGILGRPKALMFLVISANGPEFTCCLGLSTDWVKEALIKKVLQNKGQATFKSVFKSNQDVSEVFHPIHTLAPCGKWCE